MARITRPTKALQETFKQARLRKQQQAEKFKSLPVEERVGYILHNQNPSEFEIQSFLYEGLKQLGYTVRGEVGTRCGTCVFDLVVVIEDRPARIIEVKKERAHGDKITKRRTGRARAAQVSRYASFGVTVDTVCAMREAKAYLEKIKAHGFGPVVTPQPLDDS